MFRSLKTDPAQCALPRKVSNLVLQLVERNGKAFFQAYKARVEAPDRFLGPPKLPGYKDKLKGRFINADVNGTDNIIRKAIPNAFADGIEGVTVRLVRVTPA